MEKAKKGVEILVLIISLSIIGISGYTYFTNTGTLYTYLFGYKPVLVLSDRLSPDIEENSLAIVKKTKDYSVGDIVAYVHGDKFVTHRLKDVNPNITSTNDGDDPYNIEDKDIQGKVIFKTKAFSEDIKLIRDYTYVGIAKLALKFIKTILLLFLIIEGVKILLNGREKKINVKKNNE